MENIYKKFNEDFFKRNIVWFDKSGKIQVRTITFGEKENLDLTGTFLNQKTKGN